MFSLKSEYTEQGGDLFTECTFVCLKIELIVRERFLLCKRLTGRFRSLCSNQLQPRILKVLIALNWRLTDLTDLLDVDH